ncbi:hypothetical protein F3Y22_tig00110893pilonHSYRG00665 [Hibiscus syriacus]|uniref:Reverse transcriptase domain-containing protein n=1 Tax=Hibiscus syriacus TaxID=106335 RepID=A0A6A2ZIU8_HIBSY|nr:hypothetical protein F3Y22_tig00110893pilonHSYRG00665 [Hibiscus syriacus]
MPLQVEDSRNMSFEESIEVTFGDPQDMSFDVPTVMPLEVQKDVSLEVPQVVIIEAPSTLQLLKRFQQPMEFFIIKQPTPIKHPPWFAISIIVNSFSFTNFDLCCNNLFHPYDEILPTLKAIIQRGTKVKGVIQRTIIFTKRHGDSNQETNLFTNKHGELKGGIEDIEVISKHCDGSKNKVKGSSCFVKEYVFSIQRTYDGSQTLCPPIKGCEVTRFEAKRLNISCESFIGGKHKDSILPISRRYKYLTSVYVIEDDNGSDNSCRSSSGCSVVVCPDDLEGKNVISYAVGSCENDCVGNNGFMLDIVGDNIEEECIGVIDRPFDGPVFTWSNMRESCHLSRKLDMVLVNQGWLQQFPDAIVEFFALDCSDHCLNHLEYLSIVNDSWDKPVSENPLQGRKLDTFEHISKELIWHFVDSLGTVDSNMEQISNALLGEILGVELSSKMKDNLVALVTSKEIRDVLFALNGNKASSLDGYPAGFFQHAWGIVGEEFISIVKKYFYSTWWFMFYDFNPGPKDFFLHCWDLVENVLLAQELVKGYERKHLSARCALKFDLRKASDSLDWEFVFQVLRAQVRSSYSWADLKATYEACGIWLCRLTMLVELALVGGYGVVGTGQWYHGAPPRMSDEIIWFIKGIVGLKGNVKVSPPSSLAAK